MNDEVDANSERSRRLYEEVFGKGNYAAADDLMAADAVNHGPRSPPVLGTDGIKRQAALLRTAIPDLRATLNDQFGRGDRVVSRTTRCTWPALCGSSAPSATAAAPPASAASMPVPMRSARSCSKTPA